MNVYNIGEMVRASILGLVLGLSPLTALASHGDVSLSGSDFEIDVDANLTVEHASPPSLDWSNVDEARQEDLTSGQDDDSMGQGTDENTEPPNLRTGGIPNNKSDLKFFGVYNEKNAMGNFLHMYWVRVTDPSGTTLMDFEFNQSEEISSNGVTPIRMAGDLLIEYSLPEGNNFPILTLRRWLESGQWSAPTDLTASGDATGSINETAIAEEDSDGLGAMSSRTFGEASIDLDQVFNPELCQSFGFAYLKSRASNTFTTALKDFIKPVEVNVSNCGSVQIEKQDDGEPPQALQGAEFALYPEDGDDVCDADDLNGIAAGVCTTDSAGECSIDNVLQGTYCLAETKAPAGHDLDPTIHTIVITADETAGPVLFTNPRQEGAIQITKTRKHADDGSGDHPHAGVTFTITGGELPMGGTAVVTNASGVACLDGLVLSSFVGVGDYTVTEAVPLGYAADGALAKTVSVTETATCGSEDEATVSFGNTPLTDFSVSIDSLVDGGTSTTVTCKDASEDTVASGTTGADGDGTFSTTSALLPGTYTCEIVIDP